AGHRLADGIVCLSVQDGADLVLKEHTEALTRASAEEEARLGRRLRDRAPAGPALRAARRRLFGDRPAQRREHGPIPRPEGERQLRSGSPPADLFQDPRVDVGDRLEERVATRPANRPRLLEEPPEVQAPLLDECAVARIDLEEVGTAGEIGEPGHAEAG